ncbi:hypothetical protein GCM10022297_16510 [Lactobacillus hamsteri]|uniref:Uncharacterized protein n=1 Tax=Lactobacillus hamsteri DSM 5661 = JCM 6256 TaxID=1423754 RepID=A0A0R1YIU2_9LACO|nr:hypothetical protein [Lactobacillus hamsteri]KRM40820.1 hypothetical protein FC39_GL000015 [Lactobacillus hamsteri DSM 5661 = JCM 6256]
MNNFKKNISLIIATLLVVFSALSICSIHSNKVEAVSLVTKYGRGSKFTIPKSMRGTWVSKAKRSTYKKIKLTAHTVTLTPQKKHDGESYTGKWNLYYMNEKYFDKAYHTNIEVKANKYANKHRWVGARKDGSKEIFFKLGWLLDVEGSFVLRQNTKNTIRYLNPEFEGNYYRK